MTLQELSKNFALDIAKLDKQKSKTPEGSNGFLHLCNEQSACIMQMMADLKLVLERLGWGKARTV